MPPYWLSSSQDAWKPYQAMEFELTSEIRNDWIILQIAGGNVMPHDSTVTIGMEIPGSGGEGYFMFTGESFDSMVGDTATGIIWSPGNVTETTYTCFPGITGVKPVWVSGTIKIVVVL
jgi:hypothetical protein